MASSDVPMLDSPASTPDPKKQASSSSASASNTLPPEIAMVVDSQTPENETTTNWDTKKWREDVHVFASRLQHSNFNQTKYRDPLNKPLVRRPHGLSSESEERLRAYYLERKDEIARTAGAGTV